MTANEARGTRETARLHRLEQALRDNLKKRKALSRERETGARDQGAGDSPDVSPSTAQGDEGPGEAGRRAAD
ncbi:MAG: hypothetical protein NW217_13185 [Hyphomicrobiaceae bacterium]|nr:hypothetical protein [Hyphomicrobiaceae bacterium]